MEQHIKKILHITSGDCAGDSLSKSGIPGELLVWRDILYNRPRQSEWRSDENLNVRAQFLEKVTAGGMSQKQILEAI